MPAIFMLMFADVKSQNFITRTGKIRFHSHTKIEDINATNNEVFSSINTQTGNLQFLILIKGFQFKNASMQQHFNDKEYMNSTEFPKSEFKGTFTNISSINFTKDGSYPASVDGQLTMHGVANKVQATGTVIIKNGKIRCTANFKAKLMDYDIKVPSIVTTKVAEEVDIAVDCSYEPFNR